MIYFKDKFNNKYMVDDNFNIRGSSKSGLSIVKMIIDELKPFKPENGSPSLAVKSELENFKFEIIDFELPINEQIEGTIF